MKFYAVAFATLALAACLSLAPPSLVWAHETGHVEGLIVLSPAAPPARAAEPNRRPMQGRVAAIDQQGNVVAHADSDEAGTFRLELMPGNYTLHLESAGGFGHAKDGQVSVLAGQVTKTVISQESGIR